VVEDVGIGADDVGTVDLIANVVADEWGYNGKIDQGFRGWDGMTQMAAKNDVSQDFSKRDTFSVAFWVYFDPDYISSMSTSYSAIFGFASYPSQQGYRNLQYRKSGSAVQIRWANSVVSCIIAPGGWNHLVFAVTNYNGRLYLNGSLLGSDEVMDDGSVDYLTMWRGQSTLNTSAGILDDARIYDYDITYGGTTLSIIEGIYNEFEGTEQTFVEGLNEVSARSSIVNDAADTYVSTMFPGDENDIVATIDGIRRGTWTSDTLTLGTDVVATGTVTAPTFIGDLTGHADTATTATVALSVDGGAVVADTLTATGTSGISAPG
jgi:hypothetical protein